jgi:glycerol-3-phosphate O-acyltransferase
MDRNLTLDEQNIEAAIEQLTGDDSLCTKHRTLIRHFYNEIKMALIKARRPLAPFFRLFAFFLKLAQQQLLKPYLFESYHQKIRTPIDYYQFGLDFIRQLIDLPRSTVSGLQTIDRVEQQLRNGENAILFANHQTETDPQAIAILLESTHPWLAERIIYVAGERVVTDPLAIPFSMGCDLLCIYSKRYIDHPPELRAKKQIHNKNTMERMSRLLGDGGKIIYVAPGGGRDRRNANGVIEVTPFDPQSVEMFYLMARKSKTPTHFYPFTLSTYNLLPPPETVQIELGEIRAAQFTSVHLSLSPEFDMEHFPGSDEQEKEARRRFRSQAIWDIVNREHERLIR